MSETQASATTADEQSLSEMQSVLDFLKSRAEEVSELGEEDYSRHHSSGQTPRCVRLHAFRRDEPYNCPTCNRKNVEATYLVWLRPLGIRSGCSVDVERKIRYHDQRNSTPSGGRHSADAAYLLNLGITASDLLRGFVSHFKCKASGLRATADRCLLVNGGVLMLFPDLVEAKSAA